MEELISYCGLICNCCAIFLAGKETDKTKKEKMIFEIMDACKSYYGIEYKYEAINECDGCKSKSGKIFFGCKDCKIRECAMNKEIENCAYCKDYSCKILTEMFNSDPTAKERLDKIRNQNRNHSFLL